MPKSPSLSSNSQNNKGATQQSSVESPRSPQSPASPARLGSSNHEMNNISQDSHHPAPPRSAHSPTPPREESSRRFFSHHKASKSTTRVGADGGMSTMRQVSESGPSSHHPYPYKQASGSSPDVSRSLDNASISSDTTHDYDQRNDAASTKSSQHPLPSEHGSQRRPNAKNRFNLLGRSRSVRSDDAVNHEGQPPKPSPLAHRFAPSSQHGEKRSEENRKRPIPEAGLRTAPIQDKAFLDMLNSQPRTRSADREEGGQSSHQKEKKDPGFSLPAAFEKGAFFNGIKNTGERTAANIGKAGKAGKGFFGKLTRNGSSHERDHPPPIDENYVCKVINLPLVEQTRKTRISKRLAASKDKTEFWMPALPWRCIDYLNMNGCEEEGLYRVPGSGKDVKYWQGRFDRELDINLFDEEELYDINIIGSMFKAWLRELPDEIFPKAIQQKIQENCRDAKTTPQMLKDELSKLPPFNYYLLFAITCHISLLHSCSEKNKMDYRNLCICFQPCMKIEAFCFQFLVLDWRNCWQGCWTEKEYLEKEMRILEPEKYPMIPPPSSHGPPSHGNHESSQEDNERAESSGSSKPSTINSSTPDKPRPPPLNSTGAREREEEDVTPTQANRTGVRNNDLPKLSPMKPLSPIALSHN
ncbi:hypothetical protein HDK77DRAFT_28778 [Phyllosticta capitalensis]|uniref:Rho-GAP domain-containing protein n=1 Tax=Phyllosticta capitalensis TaxID=121624 RepID=A0ABR1Z049_9PEZI